jgi:hypothetical protein
MVFILHSALALCISASPYENKQTALGVSGFFGGSTKRKAAEEDLRASSRLSPGVFALAAILQYFKERQLH